MRIWWKYCTILGIFISIFFQNTHGKENRLWNATSVDLLKRDLLTDYDKYARPAGHNSVTRLSIGLTIQHIELNDKDAKLKIYGWLKMLWQDEKLKWNPDDYEGMNFVHVSDHEIWQPDLTLYNNAGNNLLDNFGNTLCIVWSNGSVLWVPPTQLEVFCELDLRRWPFDRQICSLKLGSWTYSANQIDLQPSPSDSTSDLMVKNNEWQIVNVTALRHSKIYSCCEEPYLDIEYSVTLKRNAALYKFIVITPAVCTIILLLVSFWLPVRSEEKFIFSGVLVMVTLGLLVYFAQLQPVTGLNTPFIVLFYSNCLYLASISAAIAILTVNLAKSGAGYSVPNWISGPLNGWAGTLLFITKRKHPNSGDQLTEAELQDPSTNNYKPTENSFNGISVHQNDWITLASALNRLSFIVYVIIFVVLVSASFF